MPPVRLYGEADSNPVVSTQNREPVMTRRDDDEVPGAGQVSWGGRRRGVVGCRRPGTLGDGCSVSCIILEVRGEFNSCRGLGLAIAPSGRMSSISRSRDNTGEASTNSLRTMRPRNCHCEPSERGEAISGGKRDDSVDPAGAPALLAAAGQVSPSYLGDCFAAEIPRLAMTSWAEGLRGHAGCVASSMPGESWRSQGAGRGASGEDR